MTISLVFYHPDFNIDIVRQDSKTEEWCPEAHLYLYVFEDKQSRCYIYATMYNYANFHICVNSLIDLMTAY